MSRNTWILLFWPERTILLDAMFLQIEELDSSITELKQFSNLDNVFICKIPARVDRSLINRKVALYNELLVQRFSNTEEYNSVIDTVEPEVKFYHDDGCHLGHNGIRKLCSIICPSYTRFFSPANHCARNRSGQIPPVKKGNSPNGSANNAKGFSKHSKQAHGVCNYLSTGCWNVRYFKTAQLYFKSIINSFDILALSEHCLFEEQHSLLKSGTDGTYNYHAVS